jgi:hypothetical protein
MRNSHTAALGGVLELNMIAFVANLKPAICLESFYDLPAIHENTIHIDTHSSKSNAIYKVIPQLRVAKDCHCERSEAIFGAAIAEIASSFHSSQ